MEVTECTVARTSSSELFSNIYLEPEDDRKKKKGGPYGATDNTSKEDTNETRKDPCKAPGIPGHYSIYLTKSSDESNESNAPHPNKPINANGKPKRKII